MLKTVLNTVTFFRLHLQTSLYKFAKFDALPCLLEEPGFVYQSKLTQERLNFEVSVQFRELIGIAHKKRPLRQ